RLCSFIVVIRRPTRSTRFPYTTLFRSDLLVIDICGGEEQDSLARILGFLGLPARPGLALPHENPREGRGAVASGPVRSREAVRADVDQALRDSGLPAAAGATVFP